MQAMVTADLRALSVYTSPGSLCARGAMEAWCILGQTRMATRNKVSEHYYDRYNIILLITKYKTTAFPHNSFQPPMDISITIL